MPFEKLATLMESRTDLQTTKAMLDRFEKCLLLESQSAGSSSSVENIDHLLKRLGSSKGKLTRYSLRVVLCSYMILAHPSDVLSGQVEKEKLLMEKAEKFVKEFEVLVRTVLATGESSSDAGSHGKFRSQLANFDKAWCAYLYCFVVWKLKDAKSLEEDLVRAACKLEISMMQTCKLTSNGQSHDLSHDKQAIQKQVTDDQKLLREWSKFFEAKQNENPSTMHVANISTPLSTSPMKLPTENEQMVNEMLHEDDGLFASSSDNVSSEEKDFQAKVKATMEKAFWDLVTDSIKGDKPDYTQLINLVKEVRDSLHELASKGLKDEILENIDIEILSQMLESGSQDTQYLGQILNYSLDMLAASSEVNDDGIGSFVIFVIKGLRFTLEEIKQLQTEVSKARIQLIQPIIRGSTGVEYLQEAFADRYGQPAHASTSLPITMQWVSATKSIMEQEYREHLDSIQNLPTEDHAQRLVKVLQAGRGALGAAPSSSSSAEKNSGLPECQGEKLDKLLRIGLLQLVSGMEGLQMVSNPESFNLNLRRLRALQDQFQKTIVIATSMLVLRQVLVSKIAPSKLESVISELFDSLVKILDNNPHAGSKEIMEMMLSSLASVGCLPDKQIQAATKVLLNSLQADNTIFNKVSRAVYCAFRGVVLGGSGSMGKKLVDVQLRRIGAAKLADRVVQAGEMLITMATVSECVHGPWYKALA
uniref:Uncharacterized protein n=1 Tax=Leersia perrieri TaxID=77586 RepID=A0A0D9XK28_9ORYZ